MTNLMICHQYQTFREVRLQTTVLGQLELSPNRRVSTDTDSCVCKVVCNNVDNEAKQFLAHGHPCIVEAFIHQIQWSSSKLSKIDADSDEQCDGIGLETDAYTTVVERKNWSSPNTRKYCLIFECLGGPTGCDTILDLSLLDFDVKPAPASATGKASFSLWRMPSAMIALALMDFATMLV